MEKRPYHFDGWMFALERWVPTVRNDSPSTIPFWIHIQGLPSYCYYGKGVKEIGKKLGELVNWVVQLPRVQVAVECALPLIKDWEVEFSNDEIIKVTFGYEKLDCKHCPRMSHDKHYCPKKLYSRNYRRDTRRSEHVKDGRRNRKAYADVQRYSRARPPEGMENRHGDQAESSIRHRKKPVRRNLFGDDDLPLVGSKGKEVAKESTQASVKKAYKPIRNGGADGNEVEHLPLKQGNEAVGDITKSSGKNPDGASGAEVVTTTAGDSQSAIE